ncbi:MAG: GNAT family N-acetyltransferase [Candidatus Brocadiales bacterium]
MALSIKTMTDSDVKEVQKLFNETVEELHRDRPLEERKHFKEPYTPAKVKKRLKDEHSVYLVAKENGKTVGYMFGWVLEGVGHIHWFSISKKFRGKGYGHKLLEKTLSEFEKRQCYESRVFAYPEDRVTCNFLESTGFVEKASIEEGFLGVSMVLLVKQLTKLPQAAPKRLVIAGEAGQGIKVMAHALANILAKLGKEVSLNLLYDASVRGGEITAELIFSDERIDVPFFDRADICLQLSRPARRRFDADRQIIEESIAEYVEPTDTKDIVPFKREAIERFGSPIFINMIALGRLLHHIGIPIDKVDFRSGLPARFLEENVRAIKYGYTHQD